MPELSKKEIKKRLVRLGNMERLYPVARKRIERLEKENKELKQQLASAVAIIEKLKLRIEELERMVFGRKKKDRDKEHNQPRANGLSGKEKLREPASYRRSIPHDNEITDVVDYSIANCPDCGTPLEDIKWIIRFQEDIRLLEQLLKKVEKQRIQTGHCPHCHKRRAAKPIPCQVVSLGENVKQFVCYCNVILRLSFEQTRSLLNDLANIHISDGEISKSLEQQAKKLLPKYHKLKANIRGQPAAHYDETGWRVQRECQGRWAWLLTGTETTDTVFRLGQSRGKGNAEKLKGQQNKEQVAITDDYGVYRRLFKNHQLCWAHILRKTRDLSESAQLSEKKRKRCQKVYQSLDNLHQKLKLILEQSFKVETRRRIKTKMIKRLEAIAQAKGDEPAKLKTIKQTLLKNKDKYFTCLLFEGIPTTNNKAERALRHLVLKRKNSFGSKTQKGANVMSILCSVLLSLWWRKPDNFFKEYSALLASA